LKFKRRAKIGEGRLIWEFGIGNLEAMEKVCNALIELELADLSGTSVKVPKSSYCYSDYLLGSEQH